MRFLLNYLLVLCLLASTFPAAGQYLRTYHFDGQVGRARARFNLTIASKNLFGTKAITGTYYLVSKPRKVYQLEGKLLGDELSLHEYTDWDHNPDPEVTANLILHGRWVNGFVGKVGNTKDSREFDVALYGRPSYTEE